MPFIADLSDDDKNWYVSELREWAYKYFLDARDSIRADLESYAAELAGPEDDPRTAIILRFAQTSFPDSLLDDLEGDKSVEIDSEARPALLKTAQDMIYQIGWFQDQLDRIDVTPFVTATDTTLDRLSVMWAKMTAHDNKRIKQTVRILSQDWVEAAIQCTKACDENSESDDDSDDDDSDGDGSGDDSDDSAVLKKRLEPEEASGEESEEEEESDEEDSAAEDDEDALKEMRKEAKGLKRGAPSSPSIASKRVKPSKAENA